MSHVDEGTLHAYLDGELATVERERVDTHLKGCPACQARLVEERSLIERASKLLGMAAPPERAMPPLQQLRQPRLTWRLRRPLAWAATLILAVGLGWFARGRYSRAPETAAFDSPTASPVLAEHAPGATPAIASNADRLDQKDEASVSRERDADRRQAAAGPAQAANNALAPRRPSLAAQVQGSVKPDSAKLDDVAALERGAPAISGNAPGVSLRGSRPPAARAAPTAQTPEPQAKAALTPAEAAAVSTGSSIYIDGARAQRRAPVILSSEWPIIARQPARDVLGVEPVAIPGFAIRGYRRNPAAREIVVEQVTDAGTAISLIERRVDSVDYGRVDSAATNEPRAMAKSVNERLARFVGLLRVEIDGPLTPDSLSSLLELAR
jgi:hypothetical protein